jgi:SAM-dependent methyltransferase
MPEDADAIRRAERLAFDRVPETYDRVRPVYPEALLDELFRHVGGQPSRIVEIGPGTGKATGALLTRGVDVTAVEPGPGLAAFLRQKYAGEARLCVVNATFEEAELNPGFDAVFAATSFHWVDPDVRLRKAHDLLAPGGVIAIAGTNQIASDTDGGYFARSQSVYKRYFPDEDEPALPGEDVIPAEFTEIDGSALFSDTELHRYRWDQTYATLDYADLMRSYANMQMMPPGRREALIAELSELIDREYGGEVTRPLVITLTLANRA